MKSNLRTLIVIVGIAIMPLLAGCAYYNTFFNAKRAFEDAERTRAQAGSRGWTDTQPARTATSRVVGASSSPAGARTGSDAQLYRTAIEKSAKVLAYYPESKYIDDALLLMAKSYYRLGEYNPALRKCEELLEAFPNGKHAIEAQYWRGLSLWQLARYDEAEQILRTVVEQERSAYRGNAAFALAELTEMRNRDQEAIELYQIAVRSARDWEFRARAREALGDALARSGRHEEAIPVYRGLAESARQNEARYSAYLKIAYVQRDHGDFDGALQTLDSVLESDRFALRTARTRLEIARTYLAAGDIEHATLLLEEVIEDVRLQDQSRRGAAANDGQRQIQYTPEAYEAYYWLGRIHEDRHGDFPKAALLYDTATRGRDIADSARTRKQRIDTWNELHASLADTSDSLRVLQRPLTMHRLAEHFYFEFEHPDSARIYFQTVADVYPGSSIATRANYALGWIHLEADGDSSAARTAWERVLEDTLRTVEVRSLQDAVRRDLGLAQHDSEVQVQNAYERAADEWLEAMAEFPAEPPQSLADSADTAEWWDDWAEWQRERSGRYAPLLESILDEYPSSPFATKARYILAWTAENVDRDTARARVFYAAAAADSLQAPLLASKADSVLAIRYTPKPQEIAPEHDDDVESAEQTEHGEPQVPAAPDTVTAPQDDPLQRDARRGRAHQPLPTE